MKTTNKIRKIIFVICSLFLIPLLSQWSAAQTIGISPVAVSIDDVLPNTVINRTIMLSRDITSVDMGFAVLPKGDTASWINDQQKGVLHFSPDSKTYKLDLQIYVPDSTAHGSYDGAITLTLLGAKAQSSPGASSVEQAFSIPVHISVADQPKKEYSIGTINVDSTEEQHAIPVKIKVINTGNIPAGPEKVSVRIFDKFNQGMITESILSIPSQIPAFSEGLVKVFLNHSLPSEQYLADIAVYDSKQKTDGQILQQKIIIFDILRDGQMRGNSTLQNIAGGGSSMPEEKGVFSKLNLSIIFFLVLFIGYLLWERYSKRC